MNYTTTLFVQKTIQLLLVTLGFTFSGKAQNIEVNSTWNPYGTTATQMTSTGLNNFQMHFMAADLFSVTYTSGGNPVTEPGKWFQVTPNEYKFIFDGGSSEIFASLCTDTVTVVYTIASNILTMTNVTGNCGTLNSYLNQSTWEKDGQSASIQSASTVDFQLYPNPVKEMLTVQFNDPNLEHSLEILSLIGSKMNCTLQNQLDHTVKIDVSNFPVGTYLIKVNSSSKLFVVD